MLTAYKKLLLANLSYLVIILFSVFFSSTIRAEDANTQVEHKHLTDVQQAIAKQKSTIASVSKKRTQLVNKLKKDDLLIASIARKINTTEHEQQATQKKLQQLAKEKNQLTQQKQQQELQLAKQLRAVYASGHHNYLKLVLNQEDPASVQRTLTYFHYLNNARIAEIENFQQTIAVLLQVTENHQLAAEKLVLLKVKQTKQQTILKSSKKSRGNTLAALKKELLTNKQKLAKLEAQEKNLVAALAKLAKIAQVESNLIGLKKLKKKLSWPLKGRHLKRFGARKQGYLKWKGELIKASVGSTVRSIHSGKVLFADWLNGYGLVTVIDHGDGYMSLYGHNQALLKNIGDRVETGEPIALVGQSGGQSQAGLYFEIRHRGKAMNPKAWCR